VVNLIVGTNKSEAVKKALENIRKPNGDKTRPKKEINTVESIVPSVWNELKLEGNPDCKMLESLLIRIINDLYGDWDQEDNKDESRKKAKLRDITLLSFGLLDGYPHTKGGANIWLSDRYEEYLDNSDFIELEYPGQGTYQEIKKATNIRNKREDTHVQPTPLNTLTKISGDGRDAVRDELCKKSNNRAAYKQYCNEAIEIPVSELTSICYTTDNFSPVRKPGNLTVALSDDEMGKPGKTSEKTTDQDLKKEPRVKPIKPNPSDPPAPIIDDSPDLHSKLSKMTGWLKVAVTVLIVSVFALAIIGIGGIITTQKAISLAMENSKVNQKPYSIKFRNPDEWLPFGKSYYLTVEPKPSDGTLEGLRCESKNPDIIEILSEPELHIQAIEESEDSKECNVRIKAYMSYNKSIKDEMTVHVIKDGENEPAGRGGTADGTPDTPR